MEWKQVAEWLIPIIVSAVLSYAAKELVPALRARYLADVPYKYRQVIQQVVTWAVYSAEAEGLRQGLIKAGADKREWAFSIIDAELQKHHIDISAAEIYDLIEAAVLKEFNNRKAA